MFSCDALNDTNSKSSRRRAIAKSSKFTKELLRTCFKVSVTHFYSIEISMVIIRYHSLFSCTNPEKGTVASVLYFLRTCWLEVKLINFVYLCCFCCWGRPKCTITDFSRFLWHAFVGCWSVVSETDFKQWDFFVHN